MAKVQCDGDYRFTVTLDDGTVSQFHLGDGDITYVDAKEELYRFLYGGVMSVNELSKVFFACLYKMGQQDEKIADLESRLVSAHKSRCSGKDRVIASQREELRSRGAKINESNQTIAELRKDVEDLTTDVDYYQGKIQGAALDLYNQQDENITLTSDKERLIEENQELRAKVGELNMQVTGLIADVEIQKSHGSKLRNDIDRLAYETEIRRLNALLRAEQERNEELDEECETLDGKLDTVREEVATFKKQLNLRDGNQILDDIVNKCSDGLYQETIKNLEERNEGLDEECDTLRIEVDTARSQHRKIVAECDKLNKELFKKHGRIVETNHESDRCHQWIGEFACRLDKFLTRLAAADHFFLGVAGERILIDARKVVEGWTCPGGQYPWGEA